MYISINDKKIKIKQGRIVTKGKLLFQGQGRNKPVLVSDDYPQMYDHFYHLTTDEICDGKDYSLTAYNPSIRKVVLMPDMFPDSIMKLIRDRQIREGDELRVECQHEYSDPNDEDSVSLFSIRLVNGKAIVSQ